MYRFSKEVKLLNKIIPVAEGFNQIKIKHFLSLLSIMHMAQHVTQRMDETEKSYLIFSFLNVHKTIQKNARCKIFLTGAGEMTQEINTPLSKSDNPSLVLEGINQLEKIAILTLTL